MPNTVGDHMPFGSWLPPVCWVGTRCSPPFFAGMLAESRQARLQSICCAWCSLARSTLWRLSQIPAACQSRSLRQQVMPHPQPISWGKSSQGIPVRSTNKMPVSAARLETWGRPPLGLVFTGGRRGSTNSHNSSGRIGFAMPQFYYTISGFVRSS